MFIVNVFNQKQLFLNSKTDDFISGVKTLYECNDSDIECFYVDEDDQKAIRREMKLNPNKSYEFDLHRFKLVEIIPPSKMPGQPNPSEEDPFNNYKMDDPECNASRVEVLSFKVKRVLKFNYEVLENFTTGESYKKVISIELEE